MSVPLDIKRIELGILSQIHSFVEPVISPFYKEEPSKRFDKVKCFDYDYTMGSCYDDDDFLLKIISKNINIQNCHHTQYNIGGIHLFHVLAGQVWDHSVETNEKLFAIKKRIYNLNSKYISASENKEEFESNYKLLN